MALILAIIIIAVLVGRIGYEKSVHYSNEKEIKEEVAREREWHNTWVWTKRRTEILYWVRDPKNVGARADVVKTVLEEIWKDADFSDLYPISSWEYSKTGDNEGYNKMRLRYYTRYAELIFCAKEGVAVPSESEYMSCELDKEVMIWCVNELRKHGLTNSYKFNCMRGPYFTWII